ncbi:MAG: hypothetical protein NTY68_04025 [Candidatus Micrarchaeota archaeon]|nr:hypothetical protein [Candidatus Micrarchaeota archaeon]
MPKKRRSGIWGALAWIATGAFNILYLLAKLIFQSIVGILGFIFHKAQKAGKRTARAKHPEADYRPFSVERKLAGDINEFERKISSGSTVGLILGARGSGKSALGMRILENIAAGKRRVCAMGFDESSLPNWISSVGTVDEVPNGSFVLVDEGGILFSSRESQSAGNKLLSSLLLVARHKDLSVLFISQNSANLEVNSIRQADYLLMRKPSLLQKEFERKKIGKIYDGIDFSGLPDGGRYSTYIYSDEFRGFVANELPSFWSSRASKSFAQLKLGQK